MQLESLIVSGETTYISHSIELWVVRIVESLWSLANLCLLTFARVEKDRGIPRRSWLTDGNPLWLGKIDITDEHLVRTDEGVVYARSVRRVDEYS